MTKVAPVSNDDAADKSAAAWREHRLSQLQHFRSLSLRSKMQAVEGMADVVRRLADMRRLGKLRTDDPRSP
jgi:hypothetical protein